MPRTRIGRDLLLGLLAVPGLVAVALLARSDAQWFPQEHAHTFFLVKGCLGLTAVLLLITHMSKAWSHIDTTGQRLRYIALFVGTTATGSASTQQFSSDAVVTGTSLTGLIFAATVTAAMVVSLREGRGSR